MRDCPTDIDPFDDRLRSQSIADFPKMISAIFAFATIGVFLGLSITACAKSGASSEDKEERVHTLTVPATKPDKPVEAKDFDQPSRLTPEQREKLEEALKHTHLPGPPIPAGPGKGIEEVGPSGPPSEPQSP